MSSTMVQSPCSPHHSHVHPHSPIPFSHASQSHLARNAATPSSRHPQPARRGLSSRAAEARLPLSHAAADAHWSAGAPRQMPRPARPGPYDHPARPRSRSPLPPLVGNLGERYRARESGLPPQYRAHTSVRPRAASRAPPPLSSSSAYDLAPQPHHPAGTRALDRASWSAYAVDLEGYAPSRGAQRDAKWRQKQAEAHAELQSLRMGQEVEYAQMQQAKQRAEMRVQEERYGRYRLQQLEGLQRPSGAGLRYPPRLPSPHAQAAQRLQNRRFSVPNFLPSPHQRATGGMDAYDRRASPSSTTLPPPTNGLRRSSLKSVHGQLVDRRNTLAHPLVPRSYGLPPAGHFYRRKSEASALAPQQSRRLSASSHGSSLRPDVGPAALFDGGRIPSTGLGLPPRFGPGGRVDQAQREAVLREQQVAIGEARRGIALAKAAKAQKEAKTAADKEKAEKEDDPARRRRIQLQVVVHAKPTYCRWGDCRAVLNSWGLLEKHIHHAHIKTLPPPAPPSQSAEGDDGAKAQRSEFRCHWGTCQKVYNDKERMYRHCLVEHMGEFCARCPFDCLFEGPTFPSLMAHVGRRHPKATPDDFVPGLMHLKPDVQALPPLPAEEIDITSPDGSTERNQTGIVLPFQDPSRRGYSNATSKAGLLKGSRESTLTGLNRVQKLKQSKSAMDRRVAGKVIAEVVKLAVSAAAEQRRARSASAGKVRRYVSPISSEGETPVAEGKIDIRSIAKRARAGVKAEMLAAAREASGSRLNSANLDALPGGETGVRRTAYALSESDSGSAAGVPSVDEPVVDPWAKLGFGTRLPVGKQFTTAPPSRPESRGAVSNAGSVVWISPPNLTQPAPVRITISASSTPERSETTPESDRGRDSMDHVPPRSVGAVVPAVRSRRVDGSSVISANEGGLSVVVAQGESGTLSPPASPAPGLRVRLKIPKETEGVKRAREEEEEREEREQDSAWRSRSRRRTLSES